MVLRDARCLYDARVVLMDWPGHKQSKSPCHLAHDATGLRSTRFLSNNCSTNKLSAQQLFRQKLGIPTFLIFSFPSYYIKNKMANWSDILFNKFNSNPSFDVGLILISYIKGGSTKFSLIY